MGAEDPSKRPDTGWQDRPLETRPGAGSLSRTEATRDTITRRWGVVSPAATVIGRPSTPDADLSESIRRLHDEHHAATAGYSSRAHHLDRLRTTQALCNAIDLTPWERDRVLGIMNEVDLTEYGQRGGIETVALVAIRHVVDVERRRQLGLDDIDASDLSEERLETLFEEYRERDIVDNPAFAQLAERHDLDRTALDRLRRTLRDQLGDREPVYGRNPHRDPNLPSLGVRAGAGDD